MSRAGLGARRKIEEHIEAGRIKVNGKTATLGMRAAVGDRIQFQGSNYEVVGERKTHKTLIYHKPEGELTTRSDPEGRRTVFDNLPAVRDGRWIAIGRLDINTAGMLVLTTDGELANRMMHPAGQIDREYLCRIRGEVSDADLQRLLRGVELEDGMANFSDLVIGEHTADEHTTGHTWYTVTIMEGRNREVRRLWEAVGAQVARLKRVRFGPVFLPAKLRPGQHEELSAKDHRVLREDVGLKPTPVELTLKRALRRHSLPSHHCQSRSSSRHSYCPYLRPFQPAPAPKWWRMAESSVATRNSIADSGSAMDHLMPRPAKRTCGTNEAAIISHPARPDRARTGSNLIRPENVAAGGTANANSITAATESSNSGECRSWV